MDSTSRRDFLRNGWKVGGALLIGAAAYTGYEALRPLGTGAGGAKLTLGPVSSYPANSSTPVPSGRLYITNANDYIFALSEKCPHLGCHVPYCQSSGRFECPCHGSIYDLAGEYVTGCRHRRAELRSAAGYESLPDATQGPGLHRKGVTCLANAPSHRPSNLSGSNEVSIAIWPGALCSSCCCSLVSSRTACVSPRCAKTRCAHRRPATQTLAVNCSRRIARNATAVKQPAAALHQHSTRTSSFRPRPTTRSPRSYQAGSQERKCRPGASTMAAP